MQTSNDNHLACCYTITGTAAWRLGHSYREGSDAMVTHQELYALGLLIIAIITLCHEIFRDRDHK